jgi:hypothetical protein
VVLDGVTEAMTLHGWDPNSNQDAANFGRFLATVVRSGAAVVAIDHVAKSRETRGRGPIGAQHKLAGTDVALEVRAKERPDPTRKGVLQVFVTKDREGGVRAAANASHLWALVEIIPDNGTVLVQLMDPPEGHATSVQDDEFKPTYYMARVSEYVHSQDSGSRKPPSRNQIEKGVGGKQEYVRQAIDILAREGYLEEVADGNARRYRFIDRYTEYDNE